MRNLPPAFPTDDYYDEHRNGQTPGMTLRDYFAAAVLPVVYADACRRGGDGLSTEEMVDEAYGVAEVMLERRLKEAREAAKEEELPLSE